MPDVFVAVSLCSQLTKQCLNIIITITQINFTTVELSEIY